MTFEIQVEDDGRSVSHQSRVRSRRAKPMTSAPSYQLAEMIVVSRVDGRLLHVTIEDSGSFFRRVPTGCQCVYLNLPYQMNDTGGASGTHSVLHLSSHGQCHPAVSMR